MDEEIPRLQSWHRRVRQFFDGINPNNLEFHIQVLLPEDVRNKFDIAYKKFIESMDMIMPNPTVKPYIDDLKWIGKVRKNVR